MLELLDIILLLFLVICAIAAINMRDLLSSIVVLGAYSLIMAVVWTRLNAVDVAFTEATVGAGITTMLMVAALSRTKRFELVVKPETASWKRKRFSLTKISALSVVLLTGAMLVYGTMDMPAFGDPTAPANLHLAKYFIEHSVHDVGVPNFVTAVLASYRGFDTLGETTVILTAGIAVIMLLRRKPPLTGKRKRP